MKTKFVIAATTALLLAGSAVAQEAGTSPSPTQNAPTATEPSSPTTVPATPEPMEKVAPSAPAPQAAAPPAPTTSNEPLDQAQLRKSEDDNKIVAGLNASVDKVEDMDVYDANGNKIGEVDSVLEDKDGNIKGVAIEYGGFLGFGEKGAILTLDQIKSKDGKDVMVEMTEQDFAGLPAWND